MKTSIAILALFGLIDARHHHRVSLSQGITNGTGGSNPHSNRKTFDVANKTAADVVAEEIKSENERTSVHKAAMDAQYKQTFDKNAATRTKYNWENVENNVNHNQWVVRTDPSTLNDSVWAQTSNPGDQSIGSVGMDQAVHDFIIDKSSDDQSSRFAQVDADGDDKKEKAATPDSNRELFDEDVKAAAATVAEENKSENLRTSTHKSAMDAQYKQTFDKNAATRTKYNWENVENNVNHDQWVVRSDPTTLNTGIWAQVSADGEGDDKKEKAATPDSNRALFDADVAAAAATVAEENSSESDRTSTHKAAMAAQYKQTFDKNAATRTKYVWEDVENNVNHNQWVTRGDPSTLNTAIWAQTNAPGDRTINPQGLDPRVASLLTGGDEDSNEIRSEFVQYDNENKLWRMI